MRLLSLHFLIIFLYMTEVIESVEIKLPGLTIQSYFCYKVCQSNMASVALPVLISNCHLHFFQNGVFIFPSFKCCLRPLIYSVAPPNLSRNYWFYFLIVHWNWLLSNLISIEISLGTTAGIFLRLFDCSSSTERCTCDVMGETGSGV